MNEKYKELTDRAFLLHKQNKLKEAEQIYSLLLTINPDDTNLLNLSGMLYIAKKEYTYAIKNLTKAIILNPNTYIMANLAKAYFYNNEIDNAIIIYKQAIDIKPNDDLYYSLAIAYKKINDYNSAIEAYKNAIKLNPTNYSAYFNLALIYKDKKEYKTSIEILKSAEKIKPNDDGLYSTLAEIYTCMKDYESAKAEYNRAVSINKENYIYYYNLAVLYSKSDDIKNSIINYKTSLKINPNYAPALLNLGILYNDINKLKSLHYIEKAYKIAPTENNICLAYAHILRKTGKNIKSIKLLYDILKNNPKNDNARYLLSLNMIDVGEYEKSLEICDNALKVNPKNFELIHAKAVALRYLNRCNEAKKLFAHVINGTKNNHLSCISLGMIYLKEKNFEKGMELYSKRSYDTTFFKEYKSKYWEKGTDFKDKTVLLYSDCGYGDTIMFSRYIPFLENYAKKVILRTDKTLLTLLQANYPNIEIIPKEKNCENYDIVMPIMNIAYALNMDFNNIPFSKGYLKCETDCENKDIFKKNKINVGIFYQGSQFVLKNRSIDYRHLTPLFDNNKFNFYSFQIENSQKEGIDNLSKYIKNHYDTAKFLKHTDILITVDSSIAHLAGAMGVKTYLLLPYISEWRWFDNTERTEWYDSIKIIKQTKVNSWDDVIIKLKNELMQYE